MCLIQRRNVAALNDRVLMVRHREARTEVEDGSALVDRLANDTGEVRRVLRPGRRFRAEDVPRAGPTGKSSLKIHAFQSTDVTFMQLPQPSPTSQASRVPDSYPDESQGNGTTIGADWSRTGGDNSVDTRDDPISMDGTQGPRVVASLGPRSKTSRLVHRIDASNVSDRMER